MSIIVHQSPRAPASCEAERLRAHFGLARVSDSDADPYPRGRLALAKFKAGDTLFMTNIAPPRWLRNQPEIIAFDEAVADMEKRGAA